MSKHTGLDALRSAQDWLDSGRRQAASLSN